jgi:hypothetical protein
MIGRREFGAAGLSALALAAMESPALAQRVPTKRVGAHAEHDDNLRSCAEACSDCQRECDSCSNHCAHLLHDGQREHMTTLATCQDCADVCAAASQIVARGGPFAAQICAACADVCARCAEVCDKFPDDEHMKQCAEQCRKCEKACQDMLKHLGRSKDGK